ncbi:MAG: DUF5320 domain-containing protein [Limnochordia bacterium]
MPRGDRTGPMGFGPMSGRGMGLCAGYPVPGYMNPWGRPRFWRRRWWVPYFTAPYYAPPPVPTAPSAPTQAQEAAFLRGQIQSLTEQLKFLESRLQEIESQEESKE